jgi:hypothetical protein
VLVCAALLLGAGDACLNTQVISVLGGAYKVAGPGCGHAPCRTAARRPSP